MVVNTTTWNNSYSGYKILSYRSISLFFLLVLLFSSAVVEAKNYGNTNGGFEKALYINPYYQYAIDLSRAGSGVSEIPGVDTLNKYLFYKVNSRKNGTDQYRLRFGFFIYKKSAQKIIDSLPARFSRNAFVVKVSKRERKEAVIHFLGFSENGAAPKIPIVSAPETDASQSRSQVTEEAPLPEQLDQAQLAALMKEAKKALTNRRNEKAVHILTRILQYPEYPYMRPALEYLGLARERMGEFPLAKAEYEKYLHLYKDGEGAHRVRQRIRAMLTARELPKKKLMERTRTLRKPGEWEKKTFTNWSQYFNLRLYKSGEEGYETGQSNLFSDIYFNSSLKNPEYDISFLFSGGYENDFLDKTENESQIDYLHIDTLFKNRNATGRLGRQSSAGVNGVSGRFDGVSLYYKKSEKVKFSGFAGYPVEYPVSNEIRSENPFVSLAMDLGTYDDKWEFSAFILNQRIDGITDRRALGGQIQFLNSFSSIYTLIDYDVSFNTVNNVFFSGNWFNKKNASFHIGFDFRRSPFISTSNALFTDRNFESISELLQIMSETEIRSKAEENTGFIQSVSAGGSLPLTKKLSFFGDVNLTKSNYSSNYDIFTSGQFALTDLLKSGNYTTIDSRFYSNSGSDTYSLQLRSRYPFSRAFRVIPRVQFACKIKKRSVGRRYTTSSSLKTEYRWRRKYHFELEVGGSRSVDTPSTRFDNKGSLFVLSGYRVRL